MRLPISNSACNYSFEQFRTISNLNDPMPDGICIQCAQTVYACRLIRLCCSTDRVDRQQYEALYWSLVPQVLVTKITKLCCPTTAGSNCWNSFEKLGYFARKSHHKQKRTLAFCRFSSFFRSKQFWSLTKVLSRSGPDSRWTTSLSNLNLLVRRV